MAEHCNISDICFKHNWVNEVFKTRLYVMSEMLHTILSE